MPLPPLWLKSLCTVTRGRTSIFDNHLARLRRQPLGRADIDTFGDVFAAADRGTAGRAAARCRVEVTARHSARGGAENQSIEPEPAAQTVEHAGTTAGQGCRGLGQL